MKLLTRLFKKPESSGFREAFEQSFDAIVQADSTGKIVLFNRAAELLWGYGCAEIIRKDGNKIWG